MNPDLINGLFELFGAVVTLLNVKQLRIDKVVKGFNPWTTIFFTSWGMWNIFYYPHLDQWISFYGGIGIVLANMLWLGHLWYYIKNPVEEEIIKQSFDEDVFEMYKGLIKEIDDYFEYTNESKKDRRWVQDKIYIMTKKIKARHEQNN